MTVSFRDDYFIIDFDYDPDLVAKVKSIDGSSFDSDSKLWSVPWYCASGMDVVEDFDWSEKAKEVYEEEKDKGSYRVDVEDSTLVLYFPYDKEVIDEVRTLPGSKFREKDRAWLLPPTVELPEIRDWHLSEKAEDVLEKQIDTDQFQELSLATESDIDVPVEGLYSFQKAGVEYLSKRKRTFLCDQMGTGKTCTAISALIYEDISKTVVVCPSSVKLNWVREIEKWSDFSVSICDGFSTEEDVRDELKVNTYDTDIVVLNYHILDSHLENLLDYDPECVILDESHFVKNKDSKRSKAAKELSEDREYRFLLTGTPIKNRPNEYVHQLKIMDRLAELGGFWHFVNRYCEAKKTRFGLDTSGSANEEELQRRLRSRCMIRRTKDQVLPQLPDRVRSSVPLEIDNRSEYDKANRNPINYFLERIRKREDLQNELYSKLGVSPDEVELETLLREKKFKMWNVENLVRMILLRHLSVQGKLNPSIKWIKDLEEKAVIFAIHKDIQERLLEEFPNASRIIAADDSETREENIQKFQRDDEHIICSLGAAKEGVDGLQKASSVAVYLEYPWSPTDMWQSEDRLHRSGQEDSVNIYYLTAENTIDEELVTLLRSKAETVSKSTGGSDLLEELNK